MFEHKISENISLRILQIRDESSLFKLIDENRDYLSEWLPWVKYNTEVVHTRSFIQKSLTTFANNEGMECGIFYRNKLVGIIGFHKFDWTNSSTSIGYWLDKNYQKHGIMTTCVKFLMGYAFEELLLNRIEIRCAENNIKSRAIPERLGFVKEGLLRESEYLGDKFVNHVVYSFLVREFKHEI